jgi:hypothetical protein
MRQLDQDECDARKSRHEGVLLSWKSLQQEPPSLQWTQAKF